MEALPATYMPGDAMLIENIVWELKSQGIFDTFRKECIADVDTKPAYQNLRQRVEGSVASFLRKQTWSPDLNKNQVREQLRKNIYESGYLETGVERIVDQVVNPKMTTVFLPKVTDVVYKYLGLQKPESKSEKEKEEELKTRSEELLPKELEAVSPESCHAAGDDSNLSLESMKIDDDESPPFEPLDEDNSIDSHMSGISGLQSHDSNASLKTLQIDESGSNSCPLGGDSKDGVCQADGAGDGNVAEKSETSHEVGQQNDNSNSSKSEIKDDNDDKDMDKDKVRMDKVDKDKSSENDKKSDNSEKNADKHSEKDKTDKNTEKQFDKSDKISDKERNSDRDRKRSRSDSKTSRDRHRDKESREKERERDKERDRERSRSDKDKDKDKRRHDKKSERRDRDKDRKSSSSSSSKHRSRNESERSDRDRDRRTSSSRSDNKDKREKPKDKEKKDKDDHYSAKQKGGERRSTDRDSNDGSGLKSSSSSYCESNSSSQHSHKDTSSSQKESSNDSGNSNSNSEKTKSSKVAEMAPPSSMSVSAASWDALEAQLNLNVMGLSTTTTTNEDYENDKDYDEELRYFTPSAIDKDVENLQKAEQTLDKLRQEITDVASRLRTKRKRGAESVGDESPTPSPPATKKGRSLIVGRVFVSEGKRFQLPLSPAESDSDKSTDRGKGDDLVVAATAEVRRKAVQRYSSDDLYKPRPVFKRSTARRRGNVDSY